VRLKVYGRNGKLRSTSFDGFDATTSRNVETPALKRGYASSKPWPINS
jgi:hypothetical protein